MADRPADATRIAGPTATETPSAADAVVVRGTRIVVDPRWGYRRVDPIPDEGAMERFYESAYRDAIEAGGRAPELARLITRTADADRERQWLAATLYGDVLDAIEGGAAEGAPRRMLDVGAGTGDLMRHVMAAGWEAIGIEPAAPIAAVGRDAGLMIEPATAAEYARAWHRNGDPPFGAIVLLNVLEHVPDPVGTVAVLVNLLAPGGRFVARVPNDFNPLQAAALSVLGGEPWWVTVPDHLNYFDHASFTKLFVDAGLETTDVLTDFPMELFLLMGHNYAVDPALGRDVHDRRRSLELALDPGLRRSISRGWVAAGVGRNTLVVSRRGR